MRAGRIWRTELIEEGCTQPGYVEVKQGKKGEITMTLMPMGYAPSARAVLTKRAAFTMACGLLNMAMDVDFGEGE